MLTRDTFTRRFGHRPLFAMVHLRPLPGAPLFESMESVIEAALADANAAAEADGLVFENFGDRPFYKNRVPSETVAAMTRVIAEVKPQVPFGVNVLRNDVHAALGIAAATGAAFVRVNVHTGAMLTDQGIIEGEAAETLRRRAALAPEVLIFADHLVKHAVPLGDVDPIQSAKDLRIRGLADAILVTGAETGVPPGADAIAKLRDAVDAPILIASGLNAANAKTFAAADGAIVGTSIQRDGAIDRDLLGRLRDAWTSAHARA